MTRRHLPDERPAYLSPPQVADLLGVQTRTVYDWVQRRAIPHYRVGRLVRFDRADLDAWLAERKVDVA